MSVMLDSMTWPTMLCQQLRTLQQQGLFCDVVIEVDDEKECLSAHSNVLAASSPVISSHMQQVGPLLHFPLVGAATWRLMLDFMYTGKVNVPDAYMESLSETARHFEMKQLLQLIKPEEEADKMDDQTHEEAMDISGKVACPQCSMPVMEANVWSHQTYHCPSRHEMPPSYDCTLCMEEFLEVNQLVQHVIDNHGTKDKQCSQAVDQLVQHVIDNHGTKDKQCSQAVDQLVQHVIDNHGAKDKQCSQAVDQLVQPAIGNHGAEEKPVHQQAEHVVDNHGVKRNIDNQHCVQDTVQLIDNNALQQQQHSCYKLTSSELCATFPVDTQHSHPSVSSDRVFIESKEDHTHETQLTMENPHLTVLLDKPSSSAYRQTFHESMQDKHELDKPLREQHHVAANEQMQNNMKLGEQRDGNIVTLIKQTESGFVPNRMQNEHLRKNTVPSEVLTEQTQNRNVLSKTQSKQIEETISSSRTSAEQVQVDILVDVPGNESCVKLNGSKKHLACEQCGKVFTLKRTLTRHIVAVHQQECRYKCDTCGQTFRYSQSLQRHKEGKHGEAHQATNKSTCEQCGAALSGSLAGHMWVVHGVDMSNGKRKLLQCDVCGQRANSAINLRSHMNVHTGTRAFQCFLCEASFKQASCLRKHVALHNGKKSFSCSYCGRAFARKTYLAQHERLHTGEKPYTCKVCQKSFPQKTSLNIHMRNQHDIVSPRRNGPTSLRRVQQVPNESVPEEKEMVAAQILCNMDSDGTITSGNKANLSCTYTAFNSI